MTNNTSTFTPSTQILEAAEQAQALADAGKPIARFLPQEAQQTVEGVQKIANALNSTGEALRHFGFDEAEPEVTTSEVELIPTDDLQFVDNMNPTFGDFVPDSLRPSTYVIEGGQALQENGWTGTGQAIETAGHVMRAFGYDEAEEDEIIGGDVAKEGKNVLVKASIKGVSQTIQGPLRLGLGAPGAIEGYVDPSKIEENSQTKIREADQRGEGGKVRTYHTLSPVTTAEEDLKNAAQRVHHDPNATEAQKAIAKIGHAFVYTVNRTKLAPVTFVESIGRLFVSIFDEDESEGLEAGGRENQTRAAIRDRVFGSTPETLAPIDLNSSVVSDIIQQHVAAGDDLIGGQMNKGTEPFQAQDSQYAVLA